MTQRQTKKGLWFFLREYHFDDLVPIHLRDRVRAMFGGPDAATRAFADKLARKLNWKSDFALKAILEYKKFVYLGVVSDFMVTPSTVIDQVWHEHFAFTKGYREFCDNVIGYQFDHNPELIPIDEQTGIFNFQYERTLQVYEQEFKMKPPVEIWGKPKFKKENISTEGYCVQKKTSLTSDAYIHDTTPLYLYFDSNVHHHSKMEEFNGYRSGSFGGDTNDQHQPSGFNHDPNHHNHSHVDLGHSNFGTDSTDIGGSSCSSSCSSGCSGGD